jgi:hypothetical protein
MGQLLGAQGHATPNVKSAVVRAAVGVYMTQGGRTHSLAHTGHSLLLIPL